MISPQKTQVRQTLKCAGLVFFERKVFADFHIASFAKTVFIKQKKVFAHTNNFSSFIHQGCWCVSPFKTISLQ
jgi:hypothetical protein